jgi:hypothetical protein
MPKQELLTRGDTDVLQTNRQLAISLMNLIRISLSSSSV